METERTQFDEDLDRWLRSIIDVEPPFPAPEEEDAFWDEVTILLGPA